MFVLCPVCKDPKKNLWVHVYAETVRGYGRFAGSSTAYVLEDIEQSCDCDFDEYGLDKVEEQIIADCLS